MVDHECDGMICLRRSSFVPQVDVHLTIPYSHFVFSSTIHWDALRVLVVFCVCLISSHCSLAAHHYTDIDFTVRHSSPNPLYIQPL